MWDLFFEALKSGRFCVSYCSACAKYSWPISSVCKYCASETNLRRFTKRKGKIIEFSANKASDNKTFGLVDIDGLRLIGAILDGSPAAGKAVWLHSFGVLPTGAPFFNFSTRKMV